MKIDKTRLYEIHRPRELGNDATLEHVRRLLSEEEFAKFLASRDRANTAGPMMVGGRVSQVSGQELDDMYTKALVSGANPCYVDDETGQVCMGHFVFVPKPDDD
jgi:predicted lactoylglutathione lyase